MTCKTYDNILKNGWKKTSQIISYYTYENQSKKSFLTTSCPCQLSQTQILISIYIDNLRKKLIQRIAVLKKNQVSFTIRSTNSLLQYHDKTNHDVWLWCVGFYICS